MGLVPDLGRGLAAPRAIELVGALLDNVTDGALGRHAAGPVWSG